MSVENNINIQKELGLEEDEIQTTFNEDDLESEE